MKKAFLLAIICMSLVTTGMARAFETHDHDFQVYADHHHDTDGHEIHQADHEYGYENKVADNNSTNKQSDPDMKATHSHCHSHSHDADALFYSMTDLSALSAREPMWVTNPLLAPADPIEDNLRPPSQA